MRGLAARSAMMAKSGGWSNPYVTDGLVAMWDSEFNEGNQNIVDNVGGRILTKNGNVSVSNKRFRFDGGYWGGEAIDDIYFIEMCLISVDYESVSNIIFENIGNVKSIFGQYTKISTGNRILGHSYQVGFLIPFSDGLSGTYSIGTSNLIKYRNGYLDQSNPSDYYILRTDTGLNFGARVVNSVAERFFFGEIGCLRMYSRNLSAQEVAANFAVDQARFGIT